MSEEHVRASARSRPDNVVVPGPGQLSVWDFPRPPRIEPVGPRVVVRHGGEILAQSDWALRTCERAHPPCYYFPPSDVNRSLLRKSRKTAEHMHIGKAVFWSIKLKGHSVDNAAWSFPKPAQAYEALTNHIAFFPRLVDECWVGGMRVTPQRGDYGGWITPDITGPFKGEPGSEYW